MSSPQTLTRAGEVVAQELPREGISLDLSETSSPPPSMSMSSNTHTSATSPPSTPPRGRSASRYPATLGRVPLHRRGTSQTYERLEDLLREAGYKETRVFTPEGEHDKDEGGSTRSRVGSVRAVVGFLAGLVSRNPSLARDTDTDDAPAPSSNGETTLGRGNHSVTSLDRGYSPPPSPLAHTAYPHARHAALAQNDSSRSSLATYTPLSSTDSPGASPRRSRWPLHAQTALPPHLRGRHSSTATPPRTAHAYLRHMASASSLHQQQLRPSASSRSLLSSQAEGSAAGSETPGPRRTWANGLLPMAMTMGPSKASSLSARSSPRRARTPLLCLRVEAHRAAKAEGTVSRTRVVCRSAPGSRSNSRAGSGRQGEQKLKQNNLKKPTMALRAKPSHSSLLNPHEVPCLTRTRTENDGWGSSGHPRALAHARASINGRVSAASTIMQRGRGQHPGFAFRVSDSSASRSRSVSADSHHHRHHHQHQSIDYDPDDHHDSDHIDPDDDDDDPDDSDPGDDDESDGEDGELDLNKLLVPPRRQYSIRSLRQHLHPGAGRTSRVLGSGRSSGSRVFGSTSTSRVLTTGTGTDRDRSSLLAPPSPHRLHRPQHHHHHQQQQQQQQQRDWDSDCDAANRTASRRCVDEEDEEGGGEPSRHNYGSIASFARPDERRKRGLPGSWAQWNN
ncbi:hypothetical protein CONPUDRAFT_168110 [Coniophora puteana RWD-64-598 SS2]|uniref:Uncharacterized protein n=1 Tax=Coniophora puteana (strain RWD-64-598) TaxID=741705 RepID=A0A5M3MCW3_CONPW|nr:uncharacterized protein CONPUDRAFT_168110 [Coniophora puteana RWD-64-598 SS2]EIW77092.1 hypothetical protein CONPUDRAFT_168110 [Coniophora puteana RWD-64-598 SS2]